LQPKKADSGISGPSFLGLDEPERDGRNLEYLYEDEPPRSYGRLVVAVLILAGFAVFLAYEWKQRPNWYTTIVKALPLSQRQVAAQPPPAPKENAAATAQPAPAPESKPPAVPTGADDPAADEKPAQPEAAAAPQPATTADAGPPTAEPPAAAKARSRRDAAPPPAPRNRTVKPPETAQTAAPRDTQSEQLFAKGKQYLYGTGVPRNCSQALVYLNSAANMGNTKARSQLGALYATGHCVPLDRPKAYEYFTMARDSDHGSNVWIERNRQMLWNQMSESERQRAKVATLY
jgi:hypothetical protein